MSAEPKANRGSAHQPDDRLSALKQMVARKLAEVKASKAAGAQLKPSKKRPR